MLTLTFVVSGLRAEHLTRIYFIGNSVTDTVRYAQLAELAASRDQELIWGRHMIPGAPLSWIYEHPDSGFREEPFGGYPKALNEYAWDFVSVQPFDRQLTGKNDQGEDRGDVAMIKTFAEMASRQNPDVQILIYERWPRMSREGKGIQFDKNDYDPTKPGAGVDLMTIDDYLERWNASYTGGWDLSNETKDYFEQLHTAARKETSFLKKLVKLVPVGSVMAKLHAKLKKNPIAGYSSAYHFYKDGIHLNEAGSYLVACTFYATVFQQTPVGLPTELYGTIDPKLAALIQETVWDVVQNKR